MSGMRELARSIFLSASKESTVESAFRKHVNYDRGALRICDDLFHLKSFSRVLVVSFGKAGHSMARALAGEIGAFAQGIIVTPDTGEPHLPHFRYFHGGHPLPNAESLRAGDAVLRAAANLSSNDLALFLISGGGSSMLEKPLDEQISLDDLIGFNRAIVLSGAPIAKMNALRKHLSAIKGGRLAQAAAAAQQVSILVSDVPDNALDALASGPTMPDSNTVEDCYSIVAEFNLLPQLPASIREMFERRALEETPKKDAPAFHRSRWWKVLSNETLVRHAAAEAAKAGFAVEIDNSCDDWEYSRAADHLLGKLRSLRQCVSRVCLISGGEVTVHVPETAGKGGRNQQLALYCAGKIRGENICVLSAGTDGIDGNSPAAGAVVDGTTVTDQAEATASLERFDAYTFLLTHDAGITTGPTGNNLRDLRIFLAW